MIRLICGLLWFSACHESIKPQGVDQSVKQHVQEIDRYVSGITQHQAGYRRISHPPDPNATEGDTAGDYFIGYLDHKEVQQVVEHVLGENGRNTAYYYYRNHTPIMVAVYDSTYDQQFGHVKTVNTKRYYFSDNHLLAYVSKGIEHDSLINAAIRAMADGYRTSAVAFVNRLASLSVSDVARPAHLHSDPSDETLPSSIGQRSNNPECSQSGAQAALLAFAQSQTVPMARIGHSTTWQVAGPCSWLVTGVLGWSDPLSNDPITESFSAAVARQNDGSYGVDMFQITGVYH